jgi:hypothetical protein
MSPQQILKYLAILAALGAAGAAYFYITANAVRKVEVEQQKVVIKTERAATKGTKKVAAAGQRAAVQLDQVFAQREQEIESEQKSDVVGSGLRIPARTICLWDSANAAVLPPAGCFDDAGASDVEIRDLEKQHEREAKITHKLEQQVDVLQAWICAQALIHNGEVAPFEVCQK